MLQSLARPTRLTRVPCIPDIPPFFAQARISHRRRVAPQRVSLRSGFEGFGLGFVCRPCASAGVFAAATPPSR